MSEKFLVSEKKLKSIIFDLEQKYFIKKVEKENNQIHYVQNIDEFMNIYEKDLQKIMLNLNVRKRI